MAELLRRILWLVPVLVTGAVVLFLCLGTTRSVSEQLRQPLFYNPTPTSAQVAASTALGSLRAGEPHGSERLRLLGGAALPFILDELPSLNIAEQRQVSSALKDVAERMQIRDSHAWNIEPRMLGKPGENREADQALLFWERYRDEHALDLRPLATSRLVKRAAQRDSRVQNADLLAVDTYALPTLIGALGRISTKEDTARARRLVRVISHVTEREWKIPQNASPTQARRTATAIRQFWDREGGKWTQLGRFELLVARFSQTEFAGWIFRSARQLSGLDQPVLGERLSQLGQISLPLGAFCLLGLLILGPAVAATIQVVQLKQSRWRLERLGLRAGLASILVVLLPLLIVPASSGWSRIAFLSLVMGTTFSAFLLSRELNDRLDWRTHHVLRTRPGLRKVAGVTRWIAPSVPTLTPIAVADSALWVTCVETSSKTEGLGWAALEALRSGDLDFLMAFCIVLGIATGLAQILADLALGNGRTQGGET